MAAAFHRHFDAGLVRAFDGVFDLFDGQQGRMRERERERERARTSPTVRGIATTCGTGVKRRLYAEICVVQSVELDSTIGTNAVLRQSVSCER